MRYFLCLIYCFFTFFPALQAQQVITGLIIDAS